MREQIRASSRAMRACRSFVAKAGLSLLIATMREKPAGPRILPTCTEAIPPRAKAGKISYLPTRSGTGTLGEAASPPVTGITYHEGLAEACAPPSSGGRHIHEIRWTRVLTSADFAGRKVLSQVSDGRAGS
jgi:hypothetical protein